MRSFLGLTTYFRRFIQAYAKLAAPLTELTKDEYKRNFKWTAECQECFNKLRKILLEKPLLRIPDFTKPFKVITDASEVGLGGVLLQEDQPCAYESKKFSPTERAWDTTERELYGAVYCFQKWSIYLRYNPENVIETDHIPNTYFNTKPNLRPKEIRWLDLLSQFPGKWIYKPGKTNIADPLSRMPTFYLTAIVKSTKKPAELLEERAKAEQEPRQLIKRILEGYKTDPERRNWKYDLQPNGIYYRKDRIVIPNCPDLKTEIIKDCHDNLLAGHLGRDKTYNAVSKLFYWPKMHDDIEAHINRCHVCQTTKPNTGAYQGPLQLPEISHIPWTTISVDLITALPETGSIPAKDSIITVVDRCTKMVKLIPTVKNCNCRRICRTHDGPCIHTTRIPFRHPF